ncbi:MAG: CapA family protein [Salinirussus sp.]
MSFDAIVSGDSIITQRIRVCEDDDFRDVVDLLRDADVSHTHFETICHDYDGPEVYPAAEGGGNWLRSPPYVAEEFAWAGFDMVSHAGNHANDYSYGGLRQTWAATEAAGLELAGTGENLADARQPVFMDTEKARVGLVSMSPSLQRWARAGEQRKDVKGRPGSNPLRYHWEAGPERFEQILDLAQAMGYWTTRIGEDSLFLNPPGIHNTITRVDESDEPGLRKVVNEHDASGNLDAIRGASLDADFVIAHLHTHEHDPDGDVRDPPTFVEEYARECVTAGADIVVAQGCHAPARGLEVHDGSAIFYDPGDLFFQSDAVTRIPAEFYYRHEHDLSERPLEATPQQGYAARGLVYPWGESVTESEVDRESFGGGDNLIHPPGGFFLAPGSFVPRCRFTDDLELEAIEVHPVRWVESPKSVSGVPARARGAEAAEIIEYVDERSAPYDTRVHLEEDTGIVDV